MSSPAAKMDILLGAFGLNESKDPRHMQPGELSVCNNFVFSKDGSLEKRAGYVDINNNGALPTNTRRKYFTQGNGAYIVASDQGALGDRAHIYQRSQSNGSFYSRGIIAEPKITREPGMYTGASFLDYDAAYCNGFVCYVYIDSLTTLAYAIIADATTGAVALGPTVFNAGGANATKIKLCVVGTTFIAIYSQTGVAGLQGRYIDTTVLAAWSAATAMGGATRVVNTEWSRHSLNDRFVIAYEVAANDCQVSTWNAAIVNQATSGAVALTMTAAFQGVGVGGVNSGLTDLVWIAVVGSNGANNRIETFGLNASTMGGTVAPTVGFTNANAYRNVGVVQMTTTQCMVMADQAPTLAGRLVNWALFTSAATYSAVNASMFNVMLASEPFMTPDGAVCAWFYRQDDSDTPFGTDGKFLLANVMREDWAVAGKPDAQWAGALEEGLANISTSRRVYANKVWAYGVNQYMTGLPINIDLSSVFGTMGIERVNTDFNAYDRFYSTKLAESVYCQGQYLTDDRCTEIGFAYRPVVIGAVGTGAGAIIDGVYDWCFTYGWRSQDGVWHESAPSEVVSVAAPGFNFTATINIQTLALSNKSKLDLTAGGTVGDNPIYIVMYRRHPGTANNYFRRMSSMATAAQNDFNATTVVFTDNAADATLGISNPAAYFEGGVLTAVEPPSFIHTWVYRNRLCGIGPDQRTVWISQELQQGFAPQFATELTIRVDDTTDVLVAGCQFLEGMFLFTRTSILRVIGDGPTLSGLSSDYTKPERVDSTIGCINSVSLVVTPVGVMFQSQRGIELLNHGMQVEYIGDAVAQSTALYPYCHAALVFPEQSCVHIEMMSSADPMATSPAPTAKTLIFDYRRRRWRTETHGAVASPFVVMGAGYTSSLGLTKLIRVNSTTSCRLRQSSATEWRDGGDGGTYDFVSYEAETGWNKPDGMQGWVSWQYIRFLGERYTDSNITISAALNYGATYSQATTVAGTNVNNDSSLLVRRSPEPRRASSIRIKITDATPSPGTVGNGRGASLVGLTLEFVPLSGGYRYNKSAGKV